MLHIILLLVAALLHPQSDAPVGHESEVIAAIERTIQLDCKPPGALGSCEFDAVVMEVSAYEEGRFCGGRECKRGDNNRSSSTFQCMGQTPAQTDLYERDMLAAARQAYAVIRIGARQCPESPLAPYCGGCHRGAAQRIGYARLLRARYLWAEVRELLDPDDLDEAALLMAE